MRGHTLCMWENAALIDANIMLIKCRHELQWSWDMTINCRRYAALNYYWDTPFNLKHENRVGWIQMWMRVPHWTGVWLRLSSRYAPRLATKRPIKNPCLSTVNSLWMFIISFRPCLNKALEDLTVLMALKVKAIASSSSVATAKTHMDSAPQEAPILGKSLQMAFAITMNTKRLCPFNFFWKFWNFCWIWAVDTDLSGPRLICERKPHIAKQNVGLVILAFLCFVNATLAFAKWIRVQWAPRHETFKGGSGL